MIDRRPRMLAETAAIAVLVVVAVWSAWFATLAVQPQPDRFYLGSALGVATGRGFLEPRPMPGSRLAAFLRSDARSIDWSDVQAIEWREPPSYVRASRYLIYPLGWAWRLAGVSWDVLGILTGALHALGAVGAYVLLRMFVPLPLAMAGALWITTSTLTLKIVPQLRDYSKGPFILALLPCLAALALFAPGPRRLYPLAILTGVLAGAGIGFKMDVALMVPAALATIVLFRGAMPWSDLREKAIASMLLLAGFAAAASPVLAGLSEGSNAFHVLVLGWAPMFDAALDVVSPYDILPFYNDSYLRMVAQGETPWLDGRPIPFPSRVYDSTTMGLFVKIAATFPADVATRILAAANGATNLLFQNPDPSFFNPPLPGSAAVAATYRWMGRWDGSGALVAAAFVLVAGGHGVRSGLLALALVLGLGGYSFLQYADRHYAHNQIIPLLAILTVAWWAARIAAPWTGGRQHLAARQAAGPSGGQAFTASARRALAIAAAAGVLVLITVGGARAWQARQIGAALERFDRQPASQLPIELTPSAAGAVSVRWPAPPRHPADGAINVEHYVAEFAGGDRPVVVGVHYRSTSSDLDFSRVLAFDAPDETRLAFSVLIAQGRSEFEGLELSAADAMRLRRVSMKAGQGPMGLPMDLVMPSRVQPLFQQLSAEAEPMRPHVVCSTGPGCRALLGFASAGLAQMQPVSAGSVTQVFDAGATVTAGSIVVDAPAPTESAYIAELARLSPPGAGAAVVQGSLSRGGLMVGLLEDGRWYRQAFIDRPGRYLAVLPVEAGAAPTPLLTYAMPPGRRRHRSVTTGITFVPLAALNP